MPYHTKHLILYAALLLPILLRSQTEDLSRDLGFFNGQLVEYQRWLDRTGLGTTLRVREVQADTLLKVYLEFTYADSDSAQNAWEALRQNAARRGASRTLEDLLFLRAVSCFDVDREHLSLRLYDTYDADRDFCFKRKIFAEHNQIRVDSTRGLCRKPKPSTIPIQMGDLAQLRKGQRGEPVKARVSRTAVFEKTRLFLQTKYGPKACPSRKPTLRFTVDAPNLDEQELVVHNLCDEIIQEGQPGLCEALRYFGHDCNWKKTKKYASTCAINPSAIQVFCSKSS